MAKLNPDDPSDYLIIRAAARSLAEEDATEGEIEKKAAATAGLIRRGEMTLELREGIEKDPPHDVGVWLHAVFDTGDEGTIHIDDLDLPPGILTLDDDHQQP